MFNISNSKLEFLNRVTQAQPAFNLKREQAYFLLAVPHLLIWWVIQVSRSPV